MTFMLCKRFSCSALSIRNSDARRPENVVGSGRPSLFLMIVVSPDSGCGWLYIRPNNLTQSRAPKSCVRSARTAPEGDTTRLLWQTAQVGALKSVPRVACGACAEAAVGVFPPHALIGPVRKIRYGYLPHGRCDGLQPFYFHLCSVAPEAAVMQGLFRRLLCCYPAVHNLFDTRDRVHEGMVNGIPHKIFDGIRLLAPCVLHDFSGMAGLAVIRGHDDVDLKSHVLEAVLVLFGISAVAFVAPHGICGEVVRQFVDRDPPLDHGFFQGIGRRRL